MAKQLDTQKTVEFLGRVAKSMAGHAETLCMVIGDKYGLFRDLTAHGPGTSTELAQRNKVNERYMREWLNCMVSGKYLTFDAVTSQYAFPPEHAPVLAQDFGPYFLGGFANLLGSSYGVIPHIMESFAKGGGVDYSEYPPDFWTGMDRFSGCKFETNFVDTWMPLLDPSVEEKLKKGARVCDVGCGYGRGLRKLAKAYPKSTFIGYDILDHVVKVATKLAHEEGLSNLSFGTIGAKIDRLPSAELFDIIFVFDVIHDSADPFVLMKCIRASLRDDGIFECLDVKCSDHAGENAPYLYGISLLYCMTTSLSQGGVGLGTTGLTERVIKDLCKTAGFHGGVRQVPIPGPLEVLWECKP